MDSNCACKEHLYIIDLTKGCTKRIEVTLDESLQGYNAEIAVRKDFNTAPVILKIAPVLDNSIAIEFTSDDTNKLEIENNSNQSKYMWGIDVVNDEGVRIPIIPKAGQAVPICNVFCGVVVGGL